MCELCEEKVGYSHITDHVTSLKHRILFMVSTGYKHRILFMVSTGY